MLKKILKQILKPLHSFIAFKYFPNVYFSNKKNIIIENRVSISSNCLIINSNTGVITIKNNTWIGGNCEINCSEDSQIFIDENCSINSNTKILGNVSIFKNTSIAPNVFISSSTHLYKFDPFLPIKIQDKIFFKFNNKLVIEEDVWIGANCTIGEKSYLAKGVIIGANSFLNSKTKPYEIWGGVPAKFIKNRADFIPPFEILNPVDSPYLYRGFKNGICNSLGIVKLGKKEIYKFKIESQNKNKIQFFLDDLLLLERIVESGISSIIIEVRNIEGYLDCKYFSFKIKSTNQFKILQII